MQCYAISGYIPSIGTIKGLGDKVGEQTYNKIYEKGKHIEGKYRPHANIKPNFQMKQDKTP